MQGIQLIRLSAPGYGHIALDFCDPLCVNSELLQVNINQMIDEDEKDRTIILPTEVNIHDLHMVRAAYGLYRHDGYCYQDFRDIYTCHQKYPEIVKFLKLDEKFPNPFNLKYQCTLMIRRKIPYNKLSIYGVPGGLQKVIRSNY